jgi:hypothetical protein
LKRDPTREDQQEQENEKTADNAEGGAIGPIAHGPRTRLGPIEHQEKSPGPRGRGLQSEERALQKTKE